MAGILAQVPILCDYVSINRLGCPARVPLQNLNLHVGQCSFRPGAAPHSPLRRVVTPSTTVEDILTASPSKLQGDVALKVASHLVSAQQKEGVLEIRPGSHGKAQTWVRITKGQTPSDHAAGSTISQRTHEINQLRQLVSGGSVGSQQADELRHLRKEERDHLLCDAGLMPQGKLGQGAGLALKADLHLPWFKLRKLRRWLLFFGVVLDSEAAMRHQISKELPFELLAEQIPLADKTGNISMKPVVRYPDLVGLILHYLSQHKVANTLCWHNGALPSNEVWVKLGGDHGGGSFKLSFQIANTSHPNAIQNTIPFLVFAAPDSVENLATTFRAYAGQVKHLMDSAWQDKQIRFIFFGDYELICSCYGLSGASGKRPCLFCLLTKPEMQLPPSEQPLHEVRTLQSLEADFQEFQANGSCLSKAKLHNNVIRPALLPIPLDWVCIPALHLDLGIYSWMFHAFIADMQQLDKELAARIGTTGTHDSDSVAFAEAAELSADIANKEQLQQEMQTQIDQVQSQVNTFVHSA